MALIPPGKLDKFIEAGFNVLFEGPHGVGKTGMMKGAFGRAGLNVKYFSASTLDPWVDLIGAPKPITIKGTKARKTHEALSLIRPEWVERDDIDVIFFDELNRAPDKVLNAVMELIQYQSLNGFKLNRLKMVWAAINPEGEEDGYMVNALDPAQRDRFQVHIKVPLMVDPDYFDTVHGPQLGKALVGWWEELDSDGKNMVSPRRLDYAGEAFTKGIGLVDVLPYAVNPNSLEKELKSIPFMKAAAAADAKGLAAMVAFLKKANNTFKLTDIALNSKNAEAFALFEKWKHLIPAEIIEGVGLKSREEAEAEAKSRKARKIVPNIIKVLTSYSQTKFKTMSPIEVATLINKVDLRKDFPLAQQDTLWIELRDCIGHYRSTTHEPIMTLTSKAVINAAVHSVNNPTMFFANGMPTSLTHMLRAMHKQYPDVYSTDKIDFIKKKMTPDISALVWLP